MIERGEAALLQGPEAAGEIAVVDAGKKLGFERREGAGVIPIDHVPAMAWKFHGGIHGVARKFRETGKGEEPEV